MKRLFISFSGGETSAFMAVWLMRHLAYLYDEVVCVFANTGQENEETLRFVEQVTQHFGLNTVWVEAVIHGQNIGTTHRVVDFHTASRSGEPFEAMIQQYGIPNKAYPHCTRELKQAAMKSYISSLGWKPGTYDTAIGIRVDEIDRISKNAKKLRLFYPLISHVEMTKPRINRWWRNQPFRLDLKGYQGNCKWCWKKSLRKHLTLINENPRQYDFPERMEREYGLAGHNEDGTLRVFFRENLSTVTLRKIAASGGFTPVSDDAQDYDDQLSMDLDSSNGCSSSCEVDFEDFAA